MNKKILKKSKWQRRVESFMKQAGQEVPSGLTYPTCETRLARAKLIFEEAIETIDALGCEVKYRNDQPGEIELRVVARERSHCNFIETADGCCDLIYVALGTLSALGIPDKAIFKEVCDSNDSKFIDGHLNEHGKWIEGPSYRPADIEKVLVSIENAISEQEPTDNQ